jgi:ATP-dependent RNA helicase DDX21
MIFTETKKDCSELGLSDGMKQGTQLLHGDISQKQREMTFQVRCE